MDKTFLINRPLVVDETIDGETILIHLGTGVYYSLEGIASVIWELAAAGESEAGIVDLLKIAYPAEDGAVAGGVEALLAELIAEELLLLDPAAARAPSASPPPMPDAYVTPVLNRYTDMQAFMLTDPLHDVDEDAGWPHVRTG